MEHQKHSGLGIASFIMSIVSGIAIFILIVIAGVLENTTPGGMDENAASTAIIGLLIIAFLFVSLISLGLGIGGLIQKERKKIFAILGASFSSAEVLGTVFIIILGIATG